MLSFRKRHSSIENRQKDKSVNTHLIHINTHLLIHIYYYSVFYINIKTKSRSASILGKCKSATKE